MGHPHKIIIEEKGLVWKKMKKKRKKQVKFKHVNVKQQQTFQ
jgi:hypothetical protein